MRDVVLLKLPAREAIEPAVRRSIEIIDAYYRGEPARTHEVWMRPDVGLALVQSTMVGACETVPIHQAGDEAFAYTGYVSAPAFGAADVRRLVTTATPSQLSLAHSPGGIATFFLVDAAARLCHVWSSHGAVSGLFITRHDKRIAISNRPLLSHLVGIQRDVPIMSSKWAGRILLGGCSVWCDTPFESTTQPNPRTVVVLAGDALSEIAHPIAIERNRHADGDPAGIASLTSTALDAVAVLKRWPRAELQLSGGRDSRMVAALIKRAGIDVDPVTFATQNGGEGAAAATVARAVGLPHRIGSSEMTTGDDMVPTILTNLRRHEAMPGENRHLAYPPNGAAGVPVLQGQAHHSRGGFRSRVLRERKDMHAHLVGLNLGDMRLVDNELAIERKARLDELLHGYQIRFTPDLSYWLYNDWRITRKRIGSYLPVARDRAVVWPLMDERALCAISELSSYDRVSEVAFYGTLCGLLPALAPIPLYQNTWKFDSGPVGEARFPDGYAQRKTPITEPPGGRRAADRRFFRVSPLFRIATHDLRFSPDLRALIRPDVLRAMTELDDPAKALELPNDTIVAFAWKVVAIALTMEGTWVGHAPLSGTNVQPA